MARDDTAGKAAAKARWAAANKEKTREYRRRWRAANKERERERSRKRYEANKEQQRERHRERYRRLREAAGLPYTPQSDRQQRGPCAFCGGAKAYAKGLCRPCYARANRRGSAEYARSPGETAERKFARDREVDEATGCWAWGGATKRRSPVLRAGGRDVSARRFAYEMEHGPQPAGARFDAACGNPRCVSPAHAKVTVPLPPAAKEEAVKAALASGAAGRRGAAAKMRAAGMTYQAVGEALGVTRQAVNQLLKWAPAGAKKARMAEESREVEALLSQGVPLKEIARGLGMTLNKVRGRVAAMGYQATVRWERASAAPQGKRPVVTYAKARADLEV